MARTLLILCALAPLGAYACSDTPATNYACNGPALPASAKLAAPLSGSGGVPPTQGTLIFTGFTSRIELVPANASTAGPISTTPTALPSPLPSPIASPEFLGAPYFAVSVPALQPNTLYDTQVALGVSSCSMPQTSRYLDDGTFTTGNAP